MSRDEQMRMPHPQPTPEIGKTLKALDVKTNYHEAGDGVPVILIHGSGPGVSAWANWQFAIPALAGHFHVFAYDQLGFGYTELPASPDYCLKSWTDHLLSFMQATGIARAHLVGNSMGAAVALAAAVTHPEVVHRLVLMGAMGARFPLTAGLDATWGYTPSIANMRHVLDLFAYNRSLVTEQLVELRYKASIRPGMAEAFASMFPAPRQQGIDALAAYESLLPSIQAPTLIIHGREDRVIPLQTSLTLLNILPNAQLHIFGHCGHWTQIEYKAAFHRLVDEFLAEGGC
jgi:2-hydroxymuconate-semialdehyde hydrolase